MYLYQPILSELISIDHSTTCNHLQMRSLNPDDISLLPQWSGPESLKFSRLPVPTISSSEMVSIDVTSGVNPDDLYVTTEVALAWEEPLDFENLTRYDVWIGSRALRHFEEPEESDTTGKIFPIPVCTTYIYTYCETLLINREHLNKQDTSMFVYVYVLPFLLYMYMRVNSQCIQNASSSHS